MVKNRLWLVVFVLLSGALIWGCVEELDQGRNRVPMVWFTRAPENGEVVFQNAVNFEWIATDWDDDLGMGATYIKFEPDSVMWTEIVEDSLKEFTFEHPEGWVRHYGETTYQILNLPDTTCVFRVKVVDGRGADSTIVRRFFVRYDAEYPVIDAVTCPPAKPPNPTFCHTYTITAHDVARTPRAATPQDSLEYSYRFVRPSPLPTIESQPEWSTENQQYEVCVDGQMNPGEYKFRCKVRDRAGNTSPEYVCKFEIVKP
jgi:hypothetical protein